ncbi:TetR family transcriptional regulator [Lentzea sp. NPDC006480]|uniref:TetR/AcrR family transcriptional regulator n=1 Tax=Lentzea sp. NPDC006480 TaxID=3157176 RepID=UPI0033A9C0F8
MNIVRTPKQERSQRRRDALLQAAAELIAEGGLHAVTHRAVAARAGLPSSTAGYFFASINDLAAEALRVRVQQTVKDFLELIDSAVDADGLTNAVGHLAVDRQVELTQVSLYLEAGRNPALRGPVAEAMEINRGLAEKLLTSVGLPNAAVASSAFVALFQGFMLQHLATPDSPPSPDDLVDALRALLAGYLLTEDERQNLQQRLRVHPAG